MSTFRLRVGQLRELIAEVLNSTTIEESNPDKPYDHDLCDDEAFNKDSVLVPDKAKRQIKDWIGAMQPRVAHRRGK